MMQKIRFWTTRFEEIKYWKSFWSIFFGFQSIYQRFPKQSSLKLSLNMTAWGPQEKLITGTNKKVWKAFQNVEEKKTSFKSYGLINVEALKTNCNLIRMQETLRKCVNKSIYYLFVMVTWTSVTFISNIQAINFIDAIRLNCANKFGENVRELAVSVMTIFCYKD